MNIRTFFVTQDREKFTIQSQEQQPRSPLIQLKERSLPFQSNNQQPTQSLHQADVQVLFWVYFSQQLSPPPQTLYCCARLWPGSHNLLQYTWKPRMAQKKVSHAYWYISVVWTRLLIVCMYQRMSDKFNSSLSAKYEHMQNCYNWFKCKRKTHFNQLLIQYFLDIP